MPTPPPQTMTALVLRHHGDLDALELVEDHPVPSVEPGTVLIEVRAAAFNHHDLFTVRGMPGITLPLPVVIGLDMVGRIVEVGPGVTGWASGDRVLVNPLDREGRLMGEMHDGGMARYCRVAADQLVAVPDEVTDVQAACLPVSYGTAQRMLVGKGVVHPGDKVLVLGASGGVGTACVILARAMGCHVIAAAGSAEKGRALLEIGAHEVFDYTEHDIADWVREHHGKPHRFRYDTGVDVVVNFTGGDTWAPTLRSVKRGGRILVCGATAGYAPPEDLRYVFSFELQIIGSNAFEKQDFEELLAAVAAGRVDPVVSTVLPLREAVEGLRLMQDRAVLGKVVVEPWS
ncbi:zinc-binding dehydrogenase [Georgenia alba]|uniref:Zinc-binding dehydrogenase n=1 Tax=Georgenia alba TaxID=2233858 RepID=A0ABW2QB06_9MICO